MHVYYMQPSTLFVSVVSRALCSLRTRTQPVCSKHHGARLEWVNNHVRCSRARIWNTRTSKKPSEPGVLSMSGRVSLFHMASNFNCFRSCTEKCLRVWPLRMGGHEKRQCHTCDVTRLLPVAAEGLEYA